MLEALVAARCTPHIHDKAAAIEAYERNNAHVRATAPKDRLVLWQPGDGWEPICKALGEQVPSEPFPHANTTDMYLADCAATNIFSNLCLRLSGSENFSMLALS